MLIVAWHAIRELTVVIWVRNLSYVPQELTSAARYRNLSKVTTVPRSSMVGRLPQFSYLHTMLQTLNVYQYNPP